MIRMGLGETFEPVLQAAKLGAVWAWEALYREIAGPVTGFLRANGSTEPEVAAGDVFFELARSIDRFEGDESTFRTLVFAIAHRHLRNGRPTLEGNTRSHLAEEVLNRLRGDKGSEQEDLHQVSEEVQRALDILTPEQRDVLSLRIVVGLTLEETAEVVEKGIGAVKVLQRRALTKMRKQAETVSTPL